MPILEVKRLSKNYEKFHLSDVSFKLEKGYIMGFIGVNGAGKTTTLKAILNMIKKDGGKVFIDGQEFSEHEILLKQQIGYMFGGMDFHAKRRLKTVTDVVRRFYPNWDENKYTQLAKRFKLDMDKKIGELSSGMKVKYSLALALSHNARLFLLDEPTSGLDPAARDDLLELFQELIEDGQKSILFSTHITSDLEKCADYITYINNGRIIASDTMDNFLDSYRMVKGPNDQLNDAITQKMISYKKNAFGFSGLIKAQDIEPGSPYTIDTVDLDQIMIYHARREERV